MKFDYKDSFISEDQIRAVAPLAEAAALSLHNKTGPGNDFLGWYDLPENYDREEFSRIKDLALKIKENSKILVVIGIGGSYLGAKAALDILGQKEGYPQIVFAGNNISSDYLSQLIQQLEQKDFSINVISKSGTTTEPAIAFRVLRELLINKYGVDGAKDRVFVTTDKSRGALLSLAQREGYETFVIPDNIGGRYSVLTACGLLPIAASGANIDKLMEGAALARKEYASMELMENPCLQYAAARNILYKQGFTTEIMVNYEPSLHYLSEWWKQLFGESEGKNNIGIFPASVDNSTDLHSMGQYIQEGRRFLFETVLSVNHPNTEIVIKESQENIDGLNFLAGKTMDFVNKKAMEGTIKAHKDGGVPNLFIEIEKKDEENLGRLFYFFEKSCAVTCYMQGVNPFDQPGVEEYKKNMFALLGKPGY